MCPFDKTQLGGVAVNLLGIWGKISGLNCYFLHAEKLGGVSFWNRNVQLTKEDGDPRIKNSTLPDPSLAMYVQGNDWGITVWWVLASTVLYSFLHLRRRHLARWRIPATTTFQMRFHWWFWTTRTRHGRERFIWITPAYCHCCWKVRDKQIHQPSDPSRLTIPMEQVRFPLLCCHCTELPSVF